MFHTEVGERQEKGMLHTEAGEQQEKAMLHTEAEGTVVCCTQSRGRQQDKGMVHVPLFLVSILYGVWPPLLKSGFTVTSPLSSTLYHRYIIGSTHGV